MNALKQVFFALSIGQLMVTAVFGAPISVTRYALIIGSNTGGDDRVTLKYAVRDAKTFAKVLTDMGGVEHRHCMLVTDPDKEALLRAFERFTKLIDKKENDSRRKEAIVYYSGHADADGIILGNAWYSYKAMRKNLQGISTDVKIAVLDACASGNLTREKGGKHRKPFLYDMATSMEGYAFLTSSASDEVSQESDAIKSSFFTHYLISGMRGPADANSDGKVTLNEAYEFAYDATLQRTVKTKAGPQHAAYDIRLKGSGDLVLTDVRTASAQLQLDEKISGRVFIHDMDGHMLVELLKKVDAPMSIGLEPGTYEVVVSDAKKTASAEAVLQSGKTTILSVDQMAMMDKLATVSRGGVNPSTAVTDEYAHIPCNVSILPTIGVNSGSHKTVTYSSISILGGRTHRLRGVEISSGLSIATEEMSGIQISAVAGIGGEVTGMQLTGGVNIAHENVTGVQLAGGINSSKGVTGVQTSGACNITTDNTYGVQLAGVLNHVLGDTRLFQVAGAYNYVTGGGYALQLSGGVNIGKRNINGLQLTGGGNYIGESFQGAQLSGGVNIVKNAATGLFLTGGGNYCGNTCNGVLLSGGANIVKQESKSLQITGGYNYNGAGATAIQIAGGANITAATIRGISIAGGVNMAKEMHGFQLAGGANIGGTCTGFQLAPINICGKMRGFQLGVINICDTVEGIPMGVITLVKKIPPRYRVFLDEAGFMQVAFRSGAENFYSLLAIGSSTSMNRFQWTYGAGFGGCMKAWNGFLAIESMCYNVHQNKIWDDNNLMHIRNAVIYSFRLSPKMNFQVGPSFNIGIAWEQGRERIVHFPVTYRKFSHTWVGLWPGFVVGMEM